MFGVTSAGFVLKRLDDIRAAMRDGFVALFGASLNINSDSVAMNLVDVFAGQTSTIWEGMALSYSAFDPDSAYGEGLDNLAAISGLTRKDATPSVGTIRFVGTPGVSIPEGTVCRSVSLDLFVSTTDAAVIGGSGTVDVPASALLNGPFAFGANTVQSLVSAILGIASLTNPASFTAGRNVESDEGLRARREASLQAGGSAVDRAIAARLRAVPGVLQAFVYSNRTSATDAFGFPPKSLNAVIWPASADVDYRASLALVLDRHAPAGIGFSGAVVLTVVDEYSYANEIAFRFANPVAIYLQADLTVTGDYPLDGDTQIKDKMVALVNTLQVGDDVRPVNLYSSIAGVAGIQNVVITLKAGSAPNASDLSAVVIDRLSIAQADVTNVVVNTSPV